MNFKYVLAVFALIIANSNAAGDDSYPLFVYNDTLLAEYPYLGDGRPPVYPSPATPQVAEQFATKGWGNGVTAVWNKEWVPPPTLEGVEFDFMDWFNYSAYQYSQQYIEYTKRVISKGSKSPATKQILPHYGNPVNAEWDGYVYGYNSFQSPGMMGAMWMVQDVIKDNQAIQEFGQSISSVWGNVTTNGYDFTSWATRMAGETSAPAGCAYLTTSHDVGFCTLLPNVIGWRVSGNATLLDAAHIAADRLAGRFLPKAGVTKSWDGSAYVLRSWTILDNMMNTELLFWAGQYYQNQTYFDMAFSHANRTMFESYRVDNSSFHVMEYNFTDGFCQKKHTRQGYADGSTWSRGHAWGIYGFTQSYRYTQYQPFLDKAIGASNLMIRRIAEQKTDDNIPYWDFDAPLVLSTPASCASTAKASTTVGWRDTSAASVFASALLELVTFLDDQPELQKTYWNQARYILGNLTTYEYSTRGHADYKLHSVITQGTSNWPSCLVNQSLSYGEHYFQEAMYRMYTLLGNQQPISYATVKSTPNSQGWFNAPVEVDFSATTKLGSAVVNVQLDGGVESVLSRFTVDTDGVHQVNYYASNGDNIETPAQHLTVSIDQTAPVVEFVSDPAPIVDIGGFVSVQCVASDATSGILSTSDCPSTMITEPAWTYALSPNANILTASAMDFAGNVASTSRSFHVVSSYNGMCQVANALLPLSASDLCIKIFSAQTAGQSGQLGVKNAHINAFVALVLSQSSLLSEIQLSALVNGAKLLSSVLPAAPVNTCCFAFRSPLIPNFANVPQVQGDITLNVNNPISKYNGAPLQQGCNSRFVEFYNTTSQTWQSSYLNKNGQLQSQINVIYATGTNMNMRTIQTQDATLVGILSNTLVRVTMTCNNSQSSCALFTFGTPAMQPSLAPIGCF